MELHDHLYALGLQAGREVLADPDRLRGALQASGAAAADVELVVDAVRRGAYRGLLAALDSGVDPVQAIADTGARLARERGTDPAQARWVVAVLGFAAGRVGENDVRRQRGPALPPTPAPPQQPPSLPYSPAAGSPSYAQPASAQSSYAQSSYAQPHPPSYPPQPGAWSPPTKRSRLPLVLGGVGVLAAIAAVVVLTLVLAGGGDPGRADDGPSVTTTDPTSGPTEPTSEPTDPTSEPTEPTSDPTEGSPGRVSDDAASGYTDALLAFSTDFSDASDKLQRASTRDNGPGAKAAARELRAAVYDLDLTVRDLDLAPVQGEVNDFLKVSRRMIDALDRVEREATSAIDVNLGVVALPVTDYTASFQAVADAIDASRAGG